jgi:hypothetical protein
MKPTSGRIQRALKRWGKDIKWQESYAATQLVMAQFPSNKSVPEVLAKVCVLNDIYSTHIYNTHAAATHILACREVDKRLRLGDFALIPELAAMKLGTKVRNNYSFATKYCSHHYPNTFAIYDSFVDERLWHYQQEHHFSDFRRYQLGQYDTFMQVLSEFIDFFCLQEYSLTDIDAWLWIEGKEHAAS